jgi:putative phosphatase
MNAFEPDKHFHKVSDIPFTLLKSWGVRGILLDIDNTIASRGKDDFSPPTLRWINTAKKEGFKLTVLSNGFPWRIKRACKILEIPCLIPVYAWKPSPRNYIKGASRLGVNAAECVMVGDQPSTDIKGAKLAGMRAILVDPIDPKSDLPWTKIKRWIAGRK